MLLNMIIATTIACLFTGLGGFFVLFKKEYSKAHIDLALNAAAGIMLGAAFFSLLSPAFVIAHKMAEQHIVYGLYFVFAIALGAAILWILNVIIPHTHEQEVLENKAKVSLKTAVLFVIAISLHKLPEGLAMGVAYGAGEAINPRSLVIGIALQNIPEGLTVAISLVAANYNRLKSALVATLVGFVQPIGAIAGYLLMSISEALLPFGMALAGSTMLFVIINEMLPETYGGEKNRQSSIALFLGFIFMSFMAVILN
ncbi:MAG: ZIP family metal transporter [Alphaproteobacteria bacterium]|nr:ZIP family metal transporter [Alphaproteobacteria bacterium]